MSTQSPVARLSEELRSAQSAEVSSAQTRCAASASVEQGNRSNQSLLSMACFLEELDPERLLLSPEDCKAVCVGLVSLAGRPVLEAMLACLEGLASGA